MMARVFARVPGSSANLGAGFDCIAIAVDRWLSISAWIDDRSSTSTLDRSGTLSDLTIPPNDDLIVVGFDAACAAAGSTRPQGLHLRAESAIPVARGLGSSAAAIVAGAVVANALLDLDTSDARLFEICAVCEGHADNVAAALHGGGTLALWPSVSHVAQFSVASSLALAFAIPAFETTTAAARHVLPSTVDFRTAVTGLSLSAALIHGLTTGDEILLRAALDDVIHVPHRRHLIRDFDEVTAAARSAGAIGATLSGSGSSLVAIARREVAHAVGDAMRDAWTARGVSATAFVSPAAVPGHSVTIQHDS
jgi:homoserine kinase